MGGIIIISRNPLLNKGFTFLDRTAVPAPQ